MTDDISASQWAGMGLVARVRHWLGGWAGWEDDPVTDDMRGHVLDDRPVMTVPQRARMAILLELLEQVPTSADWGVAEYIDAAVYVEAGERIPPPDPELFTAMRESGGREPNGVVRPLMPNTITTPR